MRNSYIDITRSAAVVALTMAVGACGGGGGNDDDNNPPLPPPPPAAQPVTVTGLVQDGPVAGGSIFVFTAATVQAAFDGAAAATDRAAALAGADPIVTLTRAEADGATYQFELPEEQAGNAVFLVFDSAGANDETFGDIPFSMESHAVAGAAGSTQTVNITPHTSLITGVVRSGVDANSATADIETATATALANVVAAFGVDETGSVLLDVDDNPYTTTDADALAAASAYVGVLVRTAAELTGRSADEILAALVADVTDGLVDGDAPASTDANLAALVEEVADQLFDDTEIVAAGGSGACSETARFLALACLIDINDDLLEGFAVCNDVADEDAHAACIDEIQDDAAETKDECMGQLDARVELCVALGDGAYDPPFGPAFADNFVDPLEIGKTVEPNAYLPLATGNEWVYESTFVDDDGEEITETTTVTVTNKIKLIEGIECVVVTDIVEEDDEVIEITDDWLAQDTDGNVWYCGEIAREFEMFDGDEPELPELVNIDGSWKAGRDGAKAGILVPAEPEIGALLRNEVAFGEAEDVIEVLDLAGAESTDAANCDGVCLVVKEFTPLEPDAEEMTYYRPGTGVILEVDVESGARSELTSFNEGGGLVFEEAKLLIEHNATDADTGFQGFGDGDPYDELTITGPGDTLVLTVATASGFAGFGITELFFETNEPENAEVPIDDVLARLDKGVYAFEADMVDGEEDGATANFTHDIPSGPELVSPAEDAEAVDPTNTVLSWNPVTTDLDGEDVEIVGYQLIVEEETEVMFPTGFAQPALSIHVPASVTSVLAPAEFMRDDACYAWEVLAIEVSGNQTLSSSAFETGEGCEEFEDEDPDGLKDGKLLIEHNATDEDTGFQGFIDGDPWNSMTISDSTGAPFAMVTAASGLLDFGLTELFFETSEPLNDEVPIPDVLARLPEGEYTFTGVLAEDGEEATFTTTLTHAIPAGPNLTSPQDGDEEVDPANTVVAWEPVTTDLDGEAITVVGYQVIVEEDTDEVTFPDGFAQPVFSVYLPADATSVSVPEAFMQSDADYAYEVLAIEASGNQTLSSAEFATDGEDE